MSHISLPKVFLSDTPGVSDPLHGAPSVMKLLFFVVVPFSLLPPLMYAYAQLAHPGVVLPLLEPPLTLHEAILVGAAFFVIELLTVALMAMYIQQVGEEAGIHPEYADAYSLAAIAPIPLWLATLALAFPNPWVTAAFFAVAWFGSALLIRRGAVELYTPYDDSKTHHLANKITAVGVVTWMALVLFLVLLLSLILGWR